MGEITDRKVFYDTLKSLDERILEEVLQRSNFFVRLGYLLDERENLLERIQRLKDVEE